VRFERTGYHPWNDDCNRPFTLFSPPSLPKQLERPDPMALVDTKRMAIVADPHVLAHRAPGHHADRPERFTAALAAAQTIQAERGETWAVIPPRELLSDELVAAHSAEFVDRLMSFKGKTAQVDSDTFVAPESVDLALRSAGAIVDMTRKIASGEHSQGVALVRPPGHHATRDRSMGFCLVNNIAVAARAAADLGRIAIIDFDVHHGNGTEDIFANDPNVLYVSTHQYPLYPGTGNLTAVGARDGKGYTVNVPLSEGGDDSVYAAAFERIVLPVVDDFAPAMILISAGFDAAKADPLAQMSLSSEAFGHMTYTLQQLAEKHAQGRMALLLEGGYDLPSLTSGLEAALRGMLGRAYTLPRAPDAPDVAHAAKVHALYWKSVS
jgi:acetoin utilization deacetylase AcuC-like enzyme